MSSKIIAGFYLLIVGICIGGIIVLDIVETTIFNIDLIFRNNDYTSTLITKYDQGIILSDIVIKFGYILIGGGIFILLYETLSYMLQKSNFFVWILNILNVILMFLFGFLYAPGIVKMFAQEPKIMAIPNSESFLNQSEVILEFLCVTLIVAFFLRIILINKAMKPTIQNKQ